MITRGQRTVLAAIIGLLMSAVVCGQTFIGIDWYYGSIYKAAAGATGSKVGQLGRYSFDNFNSLAYHSGTFYASGRYWIDNIGYQYGLVRFSMDPTLTSVVYQQVYPYRSPLDVRGMAIDSNGTIYASATIGITNTHGLVRINVAADGKADFTIVGDGGYMGLDMYDDNTLLSYRWLGPYNDYKFDGYYVVSSNWGNTWTTLYSTPVGLGHAVQSVARYGDYIFSTADVHPQGGSSYSAIVQLDLNNYQETTVTTIPLGDVRGIVVVPEPIMILLLSMILMIKKRVIGYEL